MGSHFQESRLGGRAISNPDSPLDALLGDSFFKEKLEKTRNNFLEARSEEVEKHKRAVTKSVHNLAKMFLRMEYDAWHASTAFEEHKRELRKEMEGIFRQAVQDCTETVTLDEVERMTRSAGA